MPFSERRYLKRNTTEHRSGQIFEVYASEPMGTCIFPIKPQIFDHILHKQIDIVLKKWALPGNVAN